MGTDLEMRDSADNTLPVVMADIGISTDQEREEKCVSTAPVENIGTNTDPEMLDSGVDPGHPERVDKGVDSLDHPEMVDTGVDPDHPERVDTGVDPDHPEIVDTGVDPRPPLVSV